MSKQTLRINQIEALVKEQKALSIHTVSNQLNVSEMTVRRDLETLSKRNPRIKMIRGLICYDDTNATSSFIYHVSNAQGSNLDEKMRIGRIAATMIKPDDVVMIDLGSTTEWLAKAIPPSLNATVICVSYNILAPLTLYPHLKIYCPGGYYHSDTQMLESPESLSFLKNIRAKRLFSSAAGIHQQLGVTCANAYEAATKKALISSSAERILLMDSSKFGHVQTTCFTNIESYHTIITDTNISAEWENYILEKGIQLIKA